MLEILAVLVIVVAVIGLVVFKRNKPPAVPDETEEEKVCGEEGGLFFCFWLRQARAWPFVVFSLVQSTFSC